MQLVEMKVADLSADPANARKHSDRNIEAIVGSLRRFGQQKPIVVDSSGVVRAGNGTLEAARRLGWDSIKAVVSDLAGSEMTAYAIADNRTAELAEWDDEVLRETLEALQFEDEELLAATGYSDEELAAIAEAMTPAEITEDEIPELPSDPITKPGDLWILGRHRVLCGDSRDLLLMDTLLDGELADMCFTDPPYNVAYVGKTKDSLTIKNDEMSGDDFLQFLRDVYASIFYALKPGSLVYVCHADSEGMRFRQAFEESGLLLKQCLVWAKNCLVLGRQDYQWRHEPILYGWKPGARHRFYGNRKQTTVIDESEGVTVESLPDGSHSLTITANNQVVVIKVPSYEVVLQGTDELESVWKVDKPVRNGEHPTMKPVRLCARAVSHGTKTDEIVLDSFLGSGSTLMACEQLSRRCFGFEIDPKYVDVIIQRWEKLTGEKAVLATAAAPQSSEAV